MPEVHIIGYMEEGEKGGKLVFPQGEEVEIKAQGWKSF
jgi:thiamine monophosphate kinase